MEGVTGTVTLTAAAPQFADATATVTVVQPALQIVSLPTSVNATDANVSFVVQLGIPNSTASGLALLQGVRVGSSVTLTVTNSNGTAAQLVTLAGGAQNRTVVVAAGQTNSPGSVATGGIAFDPLQSGTTTVRADSPGFLTTGAGIVLITINP